MSRKKIISMGLIIAVSIGLSGCAGMKKRMAEIEARGTVEGGGYDWAIHDDYEGGNTIQTSGLPTKGAAAKASTQLCKKYGRIAQYESHQGSIVGLWTYNFNCVK